MRRLGIAALAAAAATGAAAQDGLVLDPITVEGTVAAGGASAVPAEGFRAEATGILGTDLPLQEVPATVNVVTADRLEETGARNLADALVFVPGVTFGDNGGTPTEQFIVRGFDTPIFYDGQRQAVTNQLRFPPAIVERIEILKGPAGADFTLPSFGGAINIVTRQPQPEFSARVEARLGDYNYREATVDVTGPVNAAQSLQYRFIAAYTDAAGWRDGTPDETPYLTLAPSLEWEYAPGSRALLAYVRTDSDEPLDRGIIRLPGAFPDDFAPRDWSVHQQTDSMRVDTDRLDLAIVHRLNDVFSLDLHAQHYDERNVADAFRNGATEGPPLYEADGLTWTGVDTVPILYDNSRTELEATSLSAGLTSEFAVGASRHTLVAGYVYNDNEDRFLSRDGDGRYPLVGNVIDIFDPDNDQSPDFVGFESLPDFIRGSTVRSGFAHWTASWMPRWRTVVSYRIDDFEDFVREENRPEGYAGALFSDSSADILHSVRVATSYDLTADLTAFIGFSDAAEPQTGFTRGGAAIGAIEGRSVEAGVKAMLAGGRALWSNSVFQIDEDNIAGDDPSNEGNESFVVPLGSARVRGFESELVGSVTDALELAAGLALLQSEITESPDGFEGNRFANTPDVQASLTANYRWIAAGLPDLTTSLGLLYVGDREANSANEFELPAYTLVNLGAEYALTKRVAITGYVENLFDETYYTAMQDSGRGADQIAVGDRRLISIGLRATF